MQKYEQGKRKSADRSGGQLTLQTHTEEAEPKSKSFSVGRELLHETVDQPRTHASTVADWGGGGGGQSSRLTGMASIHAHSSVRVGGRICL